ncbi:MAG: ChbG/HpnK family deacetylase [Pseudolabrys sp.]|nr:ChbG/HpnK family deacetylase [Pseudolabrys sp.]MDP2297271.1 ChbG/HpnK family deacetylase [Pseudolabrys sp.]
MRKNIRRIWLCADDYGMAPGVNDAIRQLIARKRINATSVMTAASYLGDGEAQALADLNAGEQRAALGLHVTLTAPFKPLSEGFAPLRNGAFPPHPEMMRLSMARRLDPDRLTLEIATQVRAFVEIFGRLPDFLDGHQHVQLLPQVRDAFLRVVAETAPNAWVRQGGRARGARPLHDRKGMVLDILSMGFRGKAERLGLATNPAFAGAYSFSPKANFAKTFPRFLKGLPDGGLIMCHPGFVDAALQSLDSLTTLREHEFAFFNSDAYLAVLAEHGVELAQASGESESAA